MECTYLSTDLNVSIAKLVLIDCTFQNGKIKYQFRGIITLCGSTVRNNSYKIMLYAPMVWLLNEKFSIKPCVHGGRMIHFTSMTKQNTIMKQDLKLANITIFQTSQFAFETMKLMRNSLNYNKRLHIVQTQWQTIEYMSVHCNLVW